jgi:hypothetical protein
VECTIFLVGNEHGCFVGEQFVNLHVIAEHHVNRAEIFIVGQIVGDVFAIHDLCLNTGE